MLFLQLLFHTFIKLEKVYKYDHDYFNHTSTFTFTKAIILMTEQINCCCLLKMLCLPNLDQVT